MSAGHKDEPAPVGAVLRFIQRNPGLAPFLNRFPLINRDFRVPYLAGRSIDGMTTYIDANTPLRLPKSGLEPDLTYPPHEGFEWWAMARLGLSYERAHPLAHGYEQMLIRQTGVPDEIIEQYEKESRELAAGDDHAKLPPEAFPPDLYLGPYQDDEKLLPLLQMAQMLRPQVGYG